MPSIEIPLDQIPFDAPHRVDCNESRVVVIRTGHVVRAYHDVCPHASWPVSDGDIADGLIECPGHGWQFDVTTGRCATVPGHCLIPVSVTVIGAAVRLQWMDDDAPLRRRSLHVEATV